MATVCLLSNLFQGYLIISDKHWCYHPVQGQLSFSSGHWTWQEYVLADLLALFFSLCLYICLSLGLTDFQSLFADSLAATLPNPIASCHRAWTRGGETPARTKFLMKSNRVVDTQRVTSHSKSFVLPLIKHLQQVDVHPVRDMVQFQSLSWPAYWLYVMAFDIWQTRVDF